MKRLGWALGVVALALSLPLAYVVASALPLGYDFRAYWLAAGHLVTGARVYEPVDAVLGQPDEFHYLPVVAVPFIVTLAMPIGVAVQAWLVTQIALAVLLGVWLVRQIPSVLRPWAAAGYVFFLPMVLEVTLGNVDLICLALALLAWHWRAHANRAAVPYAAAVGVKFLMLSLIPFYLAAGRARIVLRAFVVGALVLVASVPFLREPTAEYLALLPRYLDTTWVRLHAEREDPAWLAQLVWNDVFSLVVALGAVALAVVFGLRARRDVARETEWHHLALALSPYITPFGFVWTTFMICSLPLFVVALRKAYVLAPTPRRAALAGTLVCWFAMQIVQLHDLWPLVAHAVGVLGLIGITLALMALESRQTLGRSIPAMRATSTASG